MSDDRELLELAAKAAGINGMFVGRFAADGYPCNFVGIGRSSATIAPLWNPLADDGDALRLAVKLRLDVSINGDIQAAWWHGDSLEFVSESLGDDSYAATRRAIVRAAAEIGRAMP